LDGIFFFSNAKCLGLISGIEEYVGCFQFLFKLGNPKYTEPEGKGQLIDPGLDLNMESGMAEHVKDLIELTSAAQLSSLISNYFWCLLLLAPARGFWMLWKYMISPWLFAPATEQGGR